MALGFCTNRKYFQYLNALDPALAGLKLSRIILKLKEL